MRSTFVPGARVAEAIRPDHRERTATRPVAVPISSPRWGDTEIRVWPSRDAMARAIRREERTAPASSWRPVVALGLTEGY
jgi:hypothetical protein